MPAMKLFSYIVVGAIFAVLTGFAACFFWHFAVVGTRPEDAPWGDYSSIAVGAGCFIMGLIVWPFILRWFDKRNHTR
jgi:hypothetical protein